MKTLALQLLLLFQSVAPSGRATASVEGRVLTEDGMPAVGVRVTAQSVPDTAVAARDAGVMVSIVQTDASGRYRLERIPPGRYYITAGLVDFPTYYPGVITLGQAKVVSVTGGAELNGLDFPMARPAGLKVTGKLIREGNQPAPRNLRVRLSGNRTGASQNAVLASDDTFEFVNVAPGNYIISLSLANGSQPQQIVVSDKDVQVELKVPLTVAVTGKLVVENDGARPRLQLVFTDGGIRINGSLNSDGTYSVQLPPGNYGVGTASGLAEGYLMKSMVSGSTNLLQQPLTVTADSSPQFLVTLGVTSPPPWVRVKGQVKGASANTRVSMNSPGAGETLQTATNPDGTFEFPKVLPGTYTANISNGAVGNQSANLVVGNVDVLDWEIVLPGTAQISGYVMMDKAPPVPRALPLAIFQMTDVASGRSRRASASVSTSGTFSFALPEGQHRISLANPPAGYVVKSMTYGTTNLLVDPLKVDVKDQSNELKIELETSSTAVFFRISGRLTGFTPAVGVSDRVTLSAAAAGGNRETAANYDGSFEFTRVPAGNYTVRAFAAASAIDVTLPLVVGTKDLTNVEIQIPIQKPVEGHIALDDGSAAPLRFWLTLTGSTTVTVYPAMRSDGSFTARLPEGEWRVSAGGLPPGFTVKSFAYGDTDVVRNPMKVGAADNKEVRIVLAATVALVKFSGRLVTSGRLPQTVSFITPFQYETAIQPDGSFEFPKILPGTYSWCCNGGWTSITVPKGGDSSVVLRSISGKVALEQGQLESTVYVNANDGTGTSAAGVLPDRSFTLVVPENAAYNISMSAIPPGFYLKSVHYGPTELADKILRVLPGQTPSDLQIEIARRP